MFFIILIEKHLLWTWLFSELKLVSNENVISEIEASFLSWDRPATSVSDDASVLRKIIYSGVAPCLLQCMLLKNIWWKTLELGQPSSCATTWSWLYSSWTNYLPWWSTLHLFMGSSGGETSLKMEKTKLITLMKLERENIVICDLCTWWPWDLCAHQYKMGGSSYNFDRTEIFNIQ